jgi:hypothetical protein
MTHLSKHHFIYRKETNVEKKNDSYKFSISDKKRSLDFGITEDNIPTSFDNCIDQVCFLSFQNFYS